MFYQNELPYGLGLKRFYALKILPFYHIALFFFNLSETGGYLFDHLFTPTPNPHPKEKKNVLNNSMEVVYRNFSWNWTIQRTQEELLK